MPARPRRATCCRPSHSSRTTARSSHRSITAHDADLVASELEALNVADVSRTLQRLSYGEGKSDLLQLLDAERLYQQARL